MYLIPILRSFTSFRMTPWIRKIIIEEYFKPLTLSQYRLANDIGVPPRRINEIVLGKRVATVETMWETPIKKTIKINRMWVEGVMEMMDEKS